MATISDSLETILRLVGLGLYVRGFEMIVGAITSASEAYAGFDASILRAEFSLNQFGHSLPTNELVEFTRQLSLSTGETQSNVASLEAYLARFRASGEDIERASRVLVSAAQLANVPVEELGRLIERARAGHARGLWDQLGIQVKGLEGQLYSLNQIIDIVDEHTHGFADQFGQTMPGELKKAAAAVDDLKIQFGLLFSPVTLGLMRAFTAATEALAQVFHDMAAAAGIHMDSLNAAGTAASGASSATNRTLDYLEKIAFNTGPQGALGHALRGGGSFAEPGSGLGIRDFNLQYRGVR